MTELFDGAILHSISFDDLEGVSFDPLISPAQPGENLIMRPLQREDYSKGMNESGGGLPHHPPLAEESVYLALPRTTFELQPLSQGVLRARFSHL